MRKLGYTGAYRRSLLNTRPQHQSNTILLLLPDHLLASLLDKAELTRRRHRRSLVSVKI